MTVDELQVTYQKLYSLTNGKSYVGYQFTVGTELRDYLTSRHGQSRIG